jgi:hypothetical protein
MRLTPIRTLTGGALLAMAFALPATGHCNSVGTDAIAVSAAPAAPASSTLLLIAAALAFPAAMLTGAFLGPRDHPDPSGLE